MKLSSSLDPASLLRDSEHDDVIVDAVNAELREREQHIASVLQLNLVVSEHGAVHRFLDILTREGGGGCFGLDYCAVILECIPDKEGLYRSHGFVSYQGLSREPFNMFKICDPRLDEIARIVSSDLRFCETDVWIYQTNGTIHDPPCLYMRLGWQRDFFYKGCLRSRLPFDIVPDTKAFAKEVMKNCSLPKITDAAMFLAARPAAHDSTRLLLISRLDLATVPPDTSFGEAAELARRARASIEGESRKRSRG